LIELYKNNSQEMDLAYERDRSGSNPQKEKGVILPTLKHQLSQDEIDQMISMDNNKKHGNYNDETRSHAKRKSSSHRKVQREGVKKVASGVRRGPDREAGSRASRAGDKSIGSRA
jgi:hypothetical protein